METRLFGWSLVGLGGGVFLFIKGFQWNKTLRLIKDTPTSKVRSLAMGFAEIFGTVVKPKQALKTPFSNKACVYYTYQIQELRSSGKNRRWVTIDRGKNSLQFYLKDDTGKVLVDLKGAQVDIPKDHTFRSQWGRDPPTEVKSFLKKRGLHFESFFGLNKQMRYTESFLAPQDKVYIMGTAGKNPHKKEGTSIKNEDAIMIQKGKNNKYYYLSDRHETHVISAFKWKAFAGLIGGPALIIIGLFLIFLNIGML